MKSIEEITDATVRRMKPKDLWSWDKWSEEIVGDGEVPIKKTYEYQMYIEKRNKLKGKVNKELARRGVPERLVCIGGGKGLYLVNEKDVADTFVESRVRRFVSGVEISNKSLRQLSAMQRISVEDKNMLQRVAGAFELQGNALIGTIARMKSLPAVMKNRLLKSIGIDPKKV